MKTVSRIAALALLVAACAAQAEGASYLQVLEPASGTPMVEFALLTESACQRVRDQMPPQQQSLARCSAQSGEAALPWKSSLKNEQLGITVKVSARTHEICDLLVSQTRAKNGSRSGLISDCSQ
jgi:hypothetical protein